MVKIQVDYTRCDLCGLCIEYCPAHVFSSSGGRLVVDDERCVECYACIPLCPQKAISISDIDP